jgi:hypothetical protein
MDRPLRVLDLFLGPNSIARVARTMGMDVIRQADMTDLPLLHPNIVWAQLDPVVYSENRGGEHRWRDGKPRSARAHHADTQLLGAIRYWDLHWRPKGALLYVFGQEEAPTYARLVIGSLVPRSAILDGRTCHVWNWRDDWKPKEHEYRGDELFREILEASVKRIGEK